MILLILKVKKKTRFQEASQKNSMRGGKEQETKKQEKDKRR